MQEQRSMVSCSGFHTLGCMRIICKAPLKVQEVCGGPWERTSSNKVPGAAGDTDPETLWCHGQELASGADFLRSNPGHLLLPSLWTSASSLMKTQIPTTYLTRFLCVEYFQQDLVFQKPRVCHYYREIFLSCFDVFSLCLYQLFWQQNEDVQFAEPGSYLNSYSARDWGPAFPHEDLYGFGPMPSNG